LGKELRSELLGGNFICVHELRFAGKQVHVGLIGPRKRWIVVFSMVSFRGTCAKNI